jgi:7-cyano-7-deazaguanine synthase
VAIAHTGANSCHHAGVSPLGRRRCCLLLSGGVDSALVASLLLGDGWLVRALWIDYGQPAAPAERVASRALAAHFALGWQEAVVGGLIVPPEGEIPGRNDLLVAAAHACAPGWSVAIGIHAGVSYSDCSREWLNAWQAVLDVQHEGVVALLAPLAGLPKPEVLALARELQVPMSLTHSCEAGPTPCGQCLSCRDRYDDHARA